MKTLIVGNGIDIQFGGVSEYGNYAILERMLKNVNADKYSVLGFSKLDLLDILDTCEKTNKKIIQNEVGIPEENDYLFLQMEMARVRRMYTSDSSLLDIGLEDLFLAVEVLYLNSLNDEERSFCQYAKDEILQPIILDAIYNDGKINELYKNYPDSFVRYLKSHDAIFTLNYDTNIESAVEGEVPVYHIHGCFSDYANKTERKIESLKHMYCNGSMSWYWLEKFGDEELDSRYGISELKNIDGHVELLGMSPCNDEQLFIRLMENHRIKSCDYYYFIRSDAIEIRKHLCGHLTGHITDRDVVKFWKRHSA